MVHTPEQMWMYNFVKCSTQLSDAQIMVNMALDFANLEGYELQPKKSVAIHIRGNNKQWETTNDNRTCFLPILCSFPHCGASS
jgi:hypothetical protein